MISKSIYIYQPYQGYAHIIHTYEEDLTSFSHDPILIKLPKCEKEFTDSIINSLDHDNTISIYIRFGDVERIINLKEE